jgi:hypothetical protein
MLHRRMLARRVLISAGLAGNQDGIDVSPHTVAE